MFSRFIVRRALVIGALAIAVPGTTALAADAYPAKPIRVIVPFPPGGGGDTLARLTLTAVGEELGQPMIFENVGGAGGNIGTAQGVKATPDGYTVLYGTNGTLGINDTLYGNLDFSPLKDLLPVARLTEIGLVAVTRPTFGANTIQDLVETIRKNPGKVTFGSAGNGTTSHLAGVMFGQQLGLNMVHVPYRGGAPAMTDLIGGQIDMMIEISASSMPQVKGGRIKGLAVSTAERMEAAPELPTLSETVAPGFVVTAWDALMVPVGTPQHVIDRLSAATQKALARPDLKEKLTARGVMPSYLPPAETAKFIASEHKRWGDAVRASGARVE